MKIKCPKDGELKTSEECIECSKKLLSGAENVEDVSKLYNQLSVVLEVKYGIKIFDFKSNSLMCP